MLSFSVPRRDIDVMIHIWRTRFFNHICTKFFFSEENMMRGPDPPTIWNVGKQGHSSDQHYLFLIIMAFSLFLSFMGTQNSSDLSSCRTNTLCFSGSSAASNNFLLSTTFIFFLFFCCLATTGTLSRRFARGCSLSLGRLVSLKPLCLRRQEWKRLRERFAKESCGAVKGFPLGFPAPRSSPNCGRG